MSTLFREILSLTLYKIHGIPGQFQKYFISYNLLKCMYEQHDAVCLDWPYVRVCSWQRSQCWRERVMTTSCASSPSSQTSSTASQSAATTISPPSVPSARSTRSAPGGESLVMNTRRSFLWLGDFNVILLWNIVVFIYSTQVLYSV